MRFYTDLYGMFYHGPSLIHGQGCYGDLPLPKGLIVPVPCKELDHETSHTAEMDGRFFEPASPFCYLNHSNTPNAELSVDEEGRMWLEIIEDTRAAQEITFDYGV